jgi:hypothetical protein
MEAEPGFTIIDSMNKLFPTWFAGESWDGWRTVLKAAFCLPMSKRERAFFKSIAGDRDPPRHRVKELWCVCGRRSGKSAICSLIAAHAGIFFRAGLDRLRPGEKALVQTVAVDRAQAKVVHGFVASYFDFVPPLRSMVTRRTTDTVQLYNDVDIVTSSNSFRSVRGRTVLVSIFDEVAYWRDENSSAPDQEVYNAVLPSLATLPDSMMCAISSPYAKRGLLHSKHKQFFGVDDDDVLVIQAASRTLNPTLDEATIAKAYEADPSAARAEWGGEFRTDVTNFIDADVVQACVAPGTRELPPVRGIRYFGFCDPSGGSSDSMTLCIAHRDGDRVVVDAIRERRPPFSPTDVCLEFAATLKSYGVGNVQSDKYAGTWVVEALASCGIRCEQSAKPKSDLYIDLLPLLNSRRVELLDIPRLINQLVGLERRTARSGKDSIDHAPAAHDDLANAVAGAAALALGQGFFITAEMAADVIARIDAMVPARDFRWSARRHFFRPPPGQRGYPQSFLPPERRSPSNDDTTTD